MSIKINREDHENLWYGLGMTLGIGGFIAAIIARKTGGGWEVFFTALPVLPAIWLVGWFLFHLTRPPK